MPKYVREEVGKIYRTRKVKTFGDHVKEWIGAAVIVYVGFLILATLVS